MTKWYKLDNAAKVFPSVSNKRRTNVFRLSFVLKENVDSDLLNEALEITLPRFMPLKVKLKRGLFWYYLEENKEKLTVFEENPFICERFKRKENNGYLFKVSYYKKRITIEVFHSLTDGSGALELLKAIVYNYLILKGHNIPSDNIILTEIESTYEEFQDSFVKNYDKRLRLGSRGPKALQIKGNLYDRNWISLIVGNVYVDNIKEVAAKYQTTITQFLCACLIDTALKTPQLFEKKKKPFQMFVPVNLRKTFPSKTLRNFSLIISTGTNLNRQLSFEEICTIVKNDFEFGLQKDRLQAQIVANVMIEKNIIMRLVPLFIKEIVMKIGYNAWGESNNTMAISNIGKVDLPEAMQEYVDEVIFANGASENSPLNVGVISHGNKMNITFTSKIIERDFQREFFRLLSSLGISVVIETNELEV